MSIAQPIATPDGSLSLRFDDFGLDSYRLFLRAKALPESEVAYDEDSASYTITTPARFAGMLGVERPPSLVESLELSPFLFDDQATVTRIALDAKRFAVWSDCGLGKTLILIEFARQVVHMTGGKFLLASLNEVVPQIMAEARRFYPDFPIVRLESQPKMREWCASPGPGCAIVNYEKFNPRGLVKSVIPECGQLAGVGLDESSRLKGGGDSRQKKVINASFKGVEYKLSCTATPAPNDSIEFTSQAAFLEKVRTEQDIIWSYFTRDSTTHRRTVRPHAREAFFRFLASWSIYLKNPKRFGWRLDLPEVPPPAYTTHVLPCTAEQREEAARIVEGPGGGTLFVTRDTNAIERSKLAQVARGFRYVKGTSGKGRKVRLIESAKPRFVADLAASEVAAGRQVLVWTTFDAESDILTDLISGRAGDPIPFACLTGKTKALDRIKILEAFRVGDIRCLVSKPKLLGYGLNFQHCSSMIFSGFSESFEELYQAIRRAVRHGQLERVRVHFPVIEELEGETFLNLMRKSDSHERDTAEMEDNYLASYLALKGVA